MSHPIRKAKLHTFERKDLEKGGVDWIARFHPYSTYPVFFTGKTEDEAVAKAEALRAEAIEKHEQSCINRAKAAAARAAKKSKAAT